MKYLERIINDLMYKDKVTISRAVHKLIGKTDDYTTEYETLYSEVACQLSQTGVKTTAHRDDVNAALTENYRVCIAPCYDVEVNDLLDVFHNAQVFKLYVTKVFVYPPFIEMDCKRRKFAGQK